MALGIADHVWSIGELVDAALPLYRRCLRRPRRIVGGSSG